MQSRRHEEYMTVSPFSKLRKQPRFEVGGDPYVISGGYVVDRSPRARRSLSPHGKLEGSSRRVSRSERGNGSSERRDYDWHLGGGRSEKFCSVSPTYIQERKKAHYGEGAVHRKYEYAEDIDYDDSRSTRSKQVFSPYRASSRTSKERDYVDNRIMDIDGQRMMGRKLLPGKEGMIRGSYQVPPDLVPTSNYGEDHGHLPLTSHSIDVSQFEHEKLRYRDTMPSDKIPVMKLYREGDEPIFASGDASYTRASASHSKNLGSPQFKDFSGKSSGVSRDEFPSSYMEGISMLTPDEYPRSSYSPYGQRSVVEMRDLEAGERIMRSYSQGGHSPNGAQHGDYLFRNSQAIVNDGHVYPSDALHRMMPSHSRLDYDPEQMNYERREMSRMNIVHPVIDRIDQTEDLNVNMRKSAALDHPTIQLQATSEIVDTRRLPYAATEDLDIRQIHYASNHAGEYLGSKYAQVEFGRREPRDNQKSHFGLTQDHEISHLRSNYGFGRDAGPQFEMERLQDPLPIYDSEMDRLAAKKQRIKEELNIYDPSEKYNSVDDIVRHDSRTIISNKWNAHQEFWDLYDSGEDCIDEDTNVPHTSRADRYDHKTYRKEKRKYEGRDDPRVLTSEDWFSQNSLPHSQKNSVKHHKPTFKYVKGHPKLGCGDWYGSDQTNRRSGIHRQHKTWKRSDNYYEDAYANDEERSEDLVNDKEPDPSEDSDEFRQLVEDSFLMYSKKLNWKASVQRRYKEQGKAGSLFCIVCGRSLSKEFMDTRRLVTHAFMSHKAGLRAQHLALHKAICVLMGWSTSVPFDTITWVPEILPAAEALAQKEDLILWPPLVVIHNISITNDNPEQQKVVPIEGIEAFLRGGGFVGGKITVCLGSPADQSVVLVKFLGTFTGLGIAERLHNFFADNKRGREDFEQKTSNNSKSSKNWEARTGGGMLEEQLLYGYIGIAEDLVRVDFSTKKWITVKSKKEIQDLANAPVKTDDR